MKEFINPQLYFFAMLTVAIIVSRTRLKRPFLWMETFFHELSHGIAALLTLGWIHKITISFNGAGSCTTSGGWRFPILLAGYAGAVTWGAVIFLAGWQMNTENDIFLLKLLMVVVMFSTLMWVRDFRTIIIMATMLAVFYLPTQASDPLIPSLMIEFLGIYVLQSALSAPLDLIDGKHVGDGAELQNMTKVLPEGFWILLWVAYALAALFWLWQYITPVGERFMSDYPYLPWI